MSFWLIWLFCNLMLPFIAAKVGRKAQKSEILFEHLFWFLCNLIARENDTVSGQVIFVILFLLMLRRSPFEKQTIIVRRHICDSSVIKEIMPDSDYSLSGNYNHY